ncbi:hypothetical protein Poly21_57390 [Allorhodopirellula heiligendammensis]|uniref:Uncharacterized protein n=1 Tax=Allorhodopirellula heiligendammensis TaxID=2714739 RepID=A0A5C6B0Q3_9BACT|nr:hypothetical protein Poly21_57390 [Allorhodopirellula heiligendammensis]
MSDNNLTIPGWSGDKGERNVLSPVRRGIVTGIPRLYWI